MSRPTIAQRLQRRAILMSGDAPLAKALRAALPPGWSLVGTIALSDMGGFQDVLMHRFLLLDLDETEWFDPLEVLRELRMELMLNVPVFCFGGSQAVRDQARLARADRFFDRGEIVARLPALCTQFDW